MNPLVKALYEHEQDFNITFERNVSGDTIGFHLKLPATIESIKLVISYDYEYLIENKIITVWVV